MRNTLKLQTDLTQTEGTADKMSLFTENFVSGSYMKFKHNSNQTSKGVELKQVQSPNQIMEKVVTCGGKANLKSEPSGELVNL